MHNFKLEGRNREVLAATIRTFIATGDPVGSRTIARQRRDGLSPATIRNSLSDLEAAGYLEQPHTSAGRVPTEKAYLFYIEEVARRSQHLNRSDEELIRQEIHAGMADLPEVILERGSHVLSMVTHNVGIVVSATAADTVLTSIHMVPLSDHRVLVAVEPRGAPVRSRVIRVDRDYTQDELERVSNYLNQNFAGWRLEAARREIIRRLEEERALYDEVLRRLAALWRQGILDAEATGVYLEGASHLMGRPELSSPQALRNLMRALEEKERLVSLLTRYIQADSAESPVQVVIGLDIEPPMKDFALIGALCATAEGLAGRVAVLGPARMPYERVLPAVAEVARRIGEVMAEK